jgi:hypothetical protein
LGDGDDGMYVDVKKRRDGWHVLASVDATHVTEALPDDGPYKTRKEAAMAAVDQAMDWAFDNDVKVTQKDRRDALKFLMTD